MQLRIKLTVSLIQKIYLFFSLLMFLLINVDEAVGLQIMIPHINGLVMYWHVMLVLVAFLLMTNVKKGEWSIDLVGKLLLLKCATDMISYFLNIDTISDGYWGYYACSIVTAFSYCIFIQEPCSIKSYYKYYLFFGIVLAAQTLLTFSMIKVDYLDVYYKSSVNIPYGASNIIASGIVPLIILPFFMDMKKAIKILISVFLITGVVLTKSRGGLLLTFCTVAYAVLFMNVFRKDKRIKQILFVNFIIIIFILIFLLFNDTLTLFFSGYSGDNLNLDSLSSGRIGILLSDLKQFIQKPIFGHGLGLGGTNISGSHNLLVDLLYKCGVSGFLIYCVALVYIYKKKNNSYFMYFIVIMFLNSLFEVCYFSYKCDTVFWCAAGLAMNRTSTIADTPYLRGDKR